MPAKIVYPQVKDLLDAGCDKDMPQAARERLALLVTGIIAAKSAAPAQVAQALHQFALAPANIDSIERRIRRIQNDERLCQSLCVHPLVKRHLHKIKARELLLVIDPSSQKDRWVLASASLWYRGRALPLAWALWPANTRLEGDGFWRRIDALLQTVEALLPQEAQVTVLADRAFGTPAFTDLVAKRGWHYVVRVQDQTRLRDRQGRQRCVRSLVRRPGDRAKCRAQVFKKCGWREASVLAFWGRNQQSPLCLVSDRAPGWDLIALYRRRYATETLFRDYKSSGWQWEKGQVREPSHVERLLVGMALASWVALFAGTQVARELLCCAARGRRHTLPWEGRRSLFCLGLQRLHDLLGGGCAIPLCFDLECFSAPNWSQQIHAHHARAFIFGPACRRGRK